MGSTYKKLISLFILLLLWGIPLYAQNAAIFPVVHIWEMNEITLTAGQEYDNYYTDVTCWVELEGPNFSRRVYGFWDGGTTFKVRVVATEAGEWSWTSGSNQAADEGLNNRSGRFTALEWTDAEKKENPVRLWIFAADSKRACPAVCRRYTIFYDRGYLAGRQHMATSVQKRSYYR